MVVLVLAFGMPQKDYKIEKVFFVEIVSEIPEITHPDVIALFDIFSKNMHSVFSVGSAVPMFVAHTTFFSNAEAEARYNLKLPPDSPRTEEVIRESFRIVGEFVKDPQYPKKMHQAGINNMGFIMRCYEGKFDEGVESILWTMITGSWTAFEILCEDLFKCALKAHPGFFANLNLKKPNFRSLRRIRESYADWFQNAADIQQSIASDYITGLSLFRNVKAHCAGIADQPFISGVSSCNAVIIPTRGLKNGDKIEVDGELVSALIAASIKTSESLAKSINDWILSPH